MDWLADNIVAVLALAVSLFALWQSHRAAALTASLSRSAALSEIYDRMRPGRQAMHAIWDGWAKKNSDLHSQVDREQFIAYYNDGFHNAAAGSPERELSNEIHTLMHELDRVVDRIKAGEFTEDQVLRSFGHAIAMDKELLLVYLDAHWKDHDELEKPLNDRFWSNVPSIAEDAVNWKATTADLT